MNDKTPIDPAVYHALWELSGNLHSLYECLHEAADTMRKTSEALGAAGALCSRMSTEASASAYRFEPTDNAHPTEE